jgi:8-oxo-dGTP pyrophosphatase MutT (NUDIX family)
MTLAPLTLHRPPSAVLASSTRLADARRHIEAARPAGSDHERHRREMLAFVDAHPDALDRTCPPGHLTGSAMVVDPADRRFLLMLHAKLGRWFQPGGHADGDANLAGVAWREAVEETGVTGLSVAVPAIDLDIHEVGPPHGPHLHLDVRYLAIAPPGAVPVGNHESLGLRWASYDELPALDVDPGTLRMARAALAALDEIEDVRPPG